MPDLNDGDLTEERNISVVLINRYPLESIAIKTLLENKGVSVTGEAINGMDALRIVDQLKPNTIIVDVDLPDIDGIGLVETLRKRLYKGSIIVTSNKYEYFYSRCTASAGGNGFVSKKGSINIILSAVQAAHNGYSYFPFSQHRVSGEGTYARNKLQALSEQEIIVLRHLLEGASNFHIAAKMDIISKTVSTYKSRLMKKLNCQTLVELIGFANTFKIDNAYIYE